MDFIQTLASLVRHRKPGRQGAALGASTALTSTALCSAVGGNSPSGHREFMSHVYLHSWPNVFRSSFSSQDPSSSDPKSAKTSLRSPSSLFGSSPCFLEGFALPAFKLNSHVSWSVQWASLLIPAAKGKILCSLVPSFGTTQSEGTFKNLSCYMFGESASTVSLREILFWLVFVKKFIFNTWHFYLCFSLSYRCIVWPLQYLFLDLFFILNFVS